MLNKEEILKADKVYLFGDNLIYIIFDDENIIYCFEKHTNKWFKRNSCSFWESWDYAPELFLPVSNGKALSLIKLWENETNSAEKNTDKVILSEITLENKKRLSQRAFEYLTFNEEE